jgi:DNA-binding NarL/FixJ family response regulator
MTNSKQIILIDDHPISRHGVAQLIGMEDGIDVCAEAGTAAEGLETIGNCYCDLVLADITLPDKSGLELIKDIIALYPDTLILVLSMHDETLYAERVLHAGARGYIMKGAPPENLIKGIHRVLDGEIYVSEAMSSRLLKILSGQRDGGPKSPLERLTDREIEVFELIGNGKGSRDIAGQLSISIRTVDSHRANIREKLGLADGAELVRHAVRWVEAGN